MTCYTINVKPSPTPGKITGTARKCTLLFLGCRPATANNRLLYLSPSE